ncbi:hypothetical protein [Acetobacterium wieringae]|uniref:Uncharacterized protein n=1 Tax=Acetobacterium wieringae TaxID=52694 RepID=A0A1F2PC03_9FIRM|nr:hypothetical protein [Acetobacterium wieringae]OFV68950.1 hypothetical protein ACWI_34860 [Acetobacterium wieringae]
MARRNESNEEKNHRKLVKNFLSKNPIKDPNDIPGTDEGNDAPSAGKRSHC